VDGEVGVVAGMGTSEVFETTSMTGCQAFLTNILEKSEMSLGMSLMDRRLVGGDVVGPDRAADGVGSGVDAGEGAELIGEVGLIVVATFEGELGPADVGSGVELMNGALETLNAAPYFGRETYLFAKDLGEAALAPANLAGSFADAGDVGGALEVAQREIDFGRTG